MLTASAWPPPNFLEARLRLRPTCGVLVSEEANLPVAMWGASDEHVINYWRATGRRVITRLIWASTRLCAQAKPTATKLHTAPTKPSSSLLSRQQLLHAVSF